MSSGAGRLERAILKVDFYRYYKGGFCISTEEICRAVYPVATLIEKKHRVAVLQAIHRIMAQPAAPDGRSQLVNPTRPKTRLLGEVFSR